MIKYELKFLLYGLLVASFVGASDGNPLQEQFRTCRERAESEMYQSVPLATAADQLSQVISEVVDQGAEKIGVKFDKPQRPGSNVHMIFVLHKSSDSLHVTPYGFTSNESRSCVLQPDERAKIIGLCKSALSSEVCAKVQFFGVK